MAGGAIYVDASACLDLITQLQQRLKPEKFNQKMYGIMQRTARHASSILRQDLPKEYIVRKKGDITKAVQRPQVTNSGMGVGCIIPITASRGSLGTRNAKFTATGGRHGWASLKGRYRIKIKVLQEYSGTLPEEMPKQYGGKPPFRNLSAPKLNNLVFTREGKERLPIRPVKGIAIPQMVATRSRDDVQDDLELYLQDRIMHEYMRLIAHGQ